VLLDVDGVSHRYGDNVVLHDISFSVRAGECLALVGSNGAGKSTLLRLMTGRERPSEGSVRFDDREIHEDDLAIRRNVAAVLGDPVFYPDLSAREHLELVMVAHGLGEHASGRAESALADVGLAGRGDDLPTKFSAGQKQALFLAAALVRPKQLLIADEPEQHLDPEARVALGERIRALMREGVAVCFSTHQRDLALAAADRVMLLEHGRCVALGNAADVLDESP
jgi:ABC-2 type transport system ATP-binding protein